MKEAAKILVISQEINPYLSDSQIANIARKLPQYIQEKGREMRAFMPRFGCVNERRNQLHEVIRLSGMNLIINDTDHPLIIKVASIQAARMQVYFIDNDDFFQRKHTVANDKGEEFDDNDERSIFFARGVIETVKKLRWTPNVVHCHGWMTALMPLYIKKAYNDDPFFKDAKVVYSVYDDGFKKPFKPSFADFLKLDGVEDTDLGAITNGAIDYEAVSKLAIDHSDGVIAMHDNVPAGILKHVGDTQKSLLMHPGDDAFIDSYLEFYDSLFK